MICKTYDLKNIHIDLNGDVFLYSVVFPFLVMIIILSISGSLNYFKLITDETMIKINVSVLGALGSSTVIFFIMWIFQTWSGFEKWFKYC